MTEFPTLSKQLDSLVGYRVGIVLDDNSDRTLIGYGDTENYTQAVLKSVGDGYIEVWEYVRRKHFNTSSRVHHADSKIDVWKLLVTTSRIVYLQFWDDAYFETPTAKAMEAEDCDGRAEGLNDDE